jgi:peptide deformylase
MRAATQFFLLEPFIAKAVPQGKPRKDSELIFRLPVSAFRLGLSCYTPAVILEIVKYGHPVLRQKGKRIAADAVRRGELRSLAADMIETMRAANGVGLAAQQIGRAILFTVLDVTDTERPSEMFIDGTPQDVSSFMPMALVNPAIIHADGESISSEGCLSVPEITADIRRAARITVRAQTLDGQALAFDCTGLLARAIQHEVDHLNGILFVDRMDAATRASLSGKLKKLQKDTLAAMEKPAKPRRALAKL